MTEKLFLIIGVIIVVAIVAFVFGRRLGWFKASFLGASIEGKETQRPGATIGDIDNDGAGAEFRAEGQGSSINKVESKGENTKFIAKS